VDASGSGSLQPVVLYIVPKSRGLPPGGELMTLEEFESFRWKTVMVDRDDDADIPVGQVTMSALGEAAVTRRACGIAGPSLCGSRRGRTRSAGWSRRHRRPGARSAPGDAAPAAVELHRPPADREVGCGLELLDQRCRASRKGKPRVVCACGSLTGFLSVGLSAVPVVAS
jgi:hypothetical protein